MSTATLDSSVSGERPLVSVLVANYNYAHYLPVALESLRLQSYSHLEVIVCDDGSTDGSCALVDTFIRQDPRFYLIKKENGGVASALNRAYRQSQGEIICLLDADDLFEEAKLARVVPFFSQHPEVGMVVHAVQVVDAMGKEQYRLSPCHKQHVGWIAETIQARGGRWRNAPASALCFRRSLAEKLFPIPEETFRREADGFLFTLAPLLASVGCLPDALTRYRLHGANLTGVQRLELQGVRHSLDALQRINHAVNARLQQGEKPERLDLDRHLNYHENRFMLALLEGTSRLALTRSWVALSKRLLADELYGMMRKGLGIVAYGSAILLPRKSRAQWLTALLGGGLREIWQRLSGIKNHG